jgi:alanine racemase
MSRPLVATIDLDALVHNYQTLRARHGGRALAAIKANAYGHGAVRCAQALESVVDGLGVACIEEAIALREAGIQTPILLMEGFFAPTELADIDACALWTAVHDLSQVTAIEAARLTRPLTVWLKVDSGMHRLGLPPEQVRAAYQRLMASGKVGEIVLMTHFARADETDCATTMEQVARFRAAIEGIIAPVSLSNSAGIVGWPAARGDWCRPGIGLYGGRPAAVHDLSLRPVMQFDSALIAVRELPAGEPIGYGARFVTERPTRVGVVACGYADGYPRLAPNGTPVLVDGQRTRLIGRVSMDMLTVDLTDLPHARIGMPVRLWGEGLPAAEVAHAADTIDYEIFCNVKRAAFVYRGGTC